MLADPKDQDPLQTTPSLSKPATIERVVETLSVPPDLSQAELRQFLGSAFFNQNALLILYIDTVQKPLVIAPLVLTYFGRSEENHTEGSHLNLTPYGAKEKGVSRIHALLYRNEVTLEIQDLDSKNGTYLNGYRLPSQQLQVLRDRDEIILGALRIRISFQYGFTE